MSDNKQKKGLDATRINIHEDYEVTYWTKALNVSKEKLREAVAHAGTSASAVRKYLNKK